MCTVLASHAGLSVRNGHLFVQGKAQKPKKQAKPAPLVPDNSDSDVELDEEDHDIFQEFGERVDFLGSLSAEGLAQPPPDAAKRKAPSQARCCPELPIQWCMRTAVCSLRSCSQVWCVAQARASGKHGSARWHLR